MRLLVFAGSTRQQSFNRKLAGAAAVLAREAGADVTHIELGAFDVPMYNADVEAQGTPADVLRLKQLAFEHPAWIICAPEYNASYPALLKNTLDWISSPVKSDPAWTDGFKSTRGKVVGMLSASPGALGGLRSQSHLAPLLLNRTAGWRPRTTPWRAQAMPSTATGTSSRSGPERTFAPSSTRCSGPPNACTRPDASGPARRPQPDHDNPVDGFGTTVELSTGAQQFAQLSLLARQHGSTPAHSMSPTASA
jgi:NAD(P)H-dependent FMN reductase